MKTNIFHIAVLVVGVANALSVFADNIANVAPTVEARNIVLAQASSSANSKRTLHLCSEDGTIDITAKAWRPNPADPMHAEGELEITKMPGHKEAKGVPLIGAAFGMGRMDGVIQYAYLLRTSLQEIIVVMPAQSRLNMPIPPEYGRAFVQLKGREDRIYLTQDCKGE